MYCINDSFFKDIDGVIDHVIYTEDKELEDLPDDYTVEVELCDLEPIFQLDSQKLYEILSDVFDERCSEDGDEWGDVEPILKKHIDFEALNKDIPSLWFPNGEVETFTKAQLIELNN